MHVIKAVINVMGVLVLFSVSRVVGAGDGSASPSKDFVKIDQIWEKNFN